MNQNHYKHLGFEDRVRIEMLLREGVSQAEIARKIGYDRATVGREISARSTPNGYFAKHAQTSYAGKRKACHPRNKIEETTIGGFVIGKIREGWSPETIAGRIEKEIGEGIRKASDTLCAETIYQFIYDSDFGKREKLWQYLRRGKKRRTKKQGRRSQSEPIVNRVFIDERPKQVELREEVGHWESDAVIYPNKKALNTLLERKTRFGIITKLERKTAEATTAAVTSRLQGHVVKSLTQDNGTENSGHEKVSENLSAPVYFCHPYHSWEKGSNENFNGLVRRYLPRGKSIDDLAQEELDDIAWELNNRPRKVLGFSTPQEMLDYEYTQLKGSVALSSRM